MEWKQFYDETKKATDDLIGDLYTVQYHIFHDFLKKVDLSSQGMLIDELFDGDENKYIDSPGGFYKNPSEYEDSIIYNFVAMGQKENLFKWYGFLIDNLKKCYDWLYPEQREKGKIGVKK